MAETITLTGRLADFTSKAIDPTITTVSVKAPAYAPGPGVEITTSAPSAVTVGADGEVTLKVVQGVGWLHIDGIDYSDQIRFVAAPGMTTLWEAIINALPGSVMVDYLKLIADGKSQVEARAQAAVNAAAADIKWRKRPLAQGEDLNGLVSPGQYWADTWTVANSLIGRPTLTTAIDRVVVEVTANSLGNISQEWGTFGTDGKAPQLLQRTRLPDSTWGSWSGIPISDGVSWVGLESSANKPLKLDASGKMSIATNSITGNSDLVNLAFLNSAIAAAKAEVDWSTGRVTPASISTIDAAPEGWVEVWGATDATGLGLPLENSSMVLTTRLGQAGFQWQVSQAGSTATIMLRTRGVGVWNEWMPLADAIGGDSETSAAGSASGFKVVPLALTLGQPNGTRPASGSYRVPLMYNAPITRWRLHVSTKNPRTATVTGTDVQLTRVTWGEHASNGDFTTTPATVAEGVTVPGSGEDVALPWQTTAIPRGVEHLVAFDYTAGAEVPAMAGGSWSTTDTAATDTAATLRDWNTPLDWWIEAETYSTTPVIALVGDSTAVGAGAEFQVHSSWLSRYSRQVGALPVHYGSSGASTFDYRGSSAHILTRWQQLSRPDAVIWALGANDAIGTSWTVEQVKARATDSMAVVRDLISWNLYLGTAKPRNTDTAEQEAGTAEFNQWLLSLPAGARDCFDFATAIGGGTGNIPPEFDADGVHVNDAGYGAIVAAITRPVTTPPVMYQAV